VFTERSLARFIVEALGLQGGETIEVARDKLDANRIVIVRHPSSEKA
jgi:hypothetical protein